MMEGKEVVGRRRSTRFLRPYKPVELSKLQKMLAAARLASFWGNVQALNAVVIERATAPPHVVAALPTGTAIGGFQFRTAPVGIAWYLDWARLAVQGERLHELVEDGAFGINPGKSHAYLDSTFPREASVVVELTAAKMLRPTAPLSYRRAELRWFQEQYGLSEIFGDEVPEILNEMMGATTEDADAGDVPHQRP